MCCKFLGQMHGCLHLEQYIDNPRIGLRYLVKMISNAPQLLLHERLLLLVRLAVELQVRAALFV